MKNLTKGDAIMYQFIYYLAETKYRMYHELYKFKPYASTNKECVSRIELKSKYEQLLDTINQLPASESLQLKHIEEEYFNVNKED